MIMAIKTYNYTSWQPFCLLNQQFAIKFVILHCEKVLVNSEKGIAIYHGNPGRTVSGSECTCIQLSGKHHQHVPAGSK